MTTVQETDKHNAETLRAILNAFAAYHESKNKHRKAMAFIMAANAADVSLAIQYKDICASEPSPHGLCAEVISDYRQEIRNILDDGVYLFDNTEEFDIFAKLESKALTAMFGLADSQKTPYALATNDGFTIGETRFRFADEMTRVGRALISGADLP